VSLQLLLIIRQCWGPSWPWSYGSWIYNYLSMHSVPITTDVVSSNLDQGEVYNIMWKVCQWLATGWWFSLGPPVSSTNKTDRHDIQCSCNIVESGIKHHQTNNQTDNVVSLQLLLIRINKNYRYIWNNEKKELYLFLLLMLKISWKLSKKWLDKKFKKNHGFIWNIQGNIGFIHLRYIWNKF
jgi:hypothetical protein